MKSQRFQLFRSISEAPPSQWTNNHYVKFLKHRDVNLSSLVDLISIFMRKNSSGSLNEI